MFNEFIHLYLCIACKGRTAMGLFVYTAPVAAQATWPHTRKRPGVEVARLAADPHPQTCAMHMGVDVEIQQAAMNARDALRTIWHRASPNERLSSDIFSAANDIPTTHFMAEALRDLMAERHLPLGDSIWHLDIFDLSQRTPRVVCVGIP